MIDSIIIICSIIIKTENNLKTLQHIDLWKLIKSTRISQLTFIQELSSVYEWFQSTSVPQIHCSEQMGEFWWHQQLTEVLINTQENLYEGQTWNTEE